MDKQALLGGVERLYAIAPIGLCYFDTDLRYRYINAWLARINGDSVEAHLGKTIDEVLKDVAVGVEPQLRHVLETGEPILEGEVEAETPAHPGELRNFQHNFYPDRSEDGTIVGVSCVVQDITERIQMEREVIAVVERERIRIERVLCDSLGQELTGVSLAAGVLSKKLEDDRSPHVQAAQDLTATMQRMIVKTRGIARQLAPPFSADLGLCAALKALAQEVDENFDVKCNAHCSLESDIQDVEMATHLYRIAEESISNALRHSGAQMIELWYGRNGESVFLEVLDDGAGVPDVKRRAKGVGIQSMHYRARMLHARLEVGLRFEGGTRVLCSCPAQFH